jgi:uncharacterized protein (TIGR03118 family)
MTIRREVRVNGEIHGRTKRHAVFFNFYGATAMQRTRPFLASLAAGAGLSLAAILCNPAFAVPFSVNNLVTDDQAANPAQITDPGLKNGWGMSFGPTGPFWVSSTGAGTSVLYNVDPATQATTKAGLTVTIPGAGLPTGQVFNGNSSSFNGNLFLFVSLDGTVSGWRPSLGTSAETLVAGSSANVYTGAAIGNVGGSDYLYAANFKAGTIDVYNGTAAQPSLPGSFTDPNLPDGYAPFNVQNLDGTLYVAYAQRDNMTGEEAAGLGLGVVDKFGLNGDFLGRIASGGTLNAPWGLAIAPSSFCAMAGDLLVGNFGDGHINIYDPATLMPMGQVMNASNQPVVIDGLWGISPGNDGSGGSSQLLYFAAGPNDETHGLFGVLAPVPEPAEYAMMLMGLGMILLLARRHRVQARHALQPADENSL